MRLPTFLGGVPKALIVSAVLLAAVACGGNGSPGAGAASSPTRATATPTLSVCGDVDGLKSTLDSLTPLVSRLPTSTEMKTAAQDINTDVAGLSSRTEWQAQINGLKTANANMQAAADRLAATPGGRGVAASARSAVGAVNDAIRRLLTAVGSRCPATSPSATASS